MSVSGIGGNSMEKQVNDGRHSRRMLAAALLVYSAAVLGLAHASYLANDHHIVYALDDAYIHMAIAKNIVQYGTFGITPDEFTLSSSPLWTILLAGLFRAFGTSEWIPLLLNYAFGAAAILVIWKFGVDAGIRGVGLGLLLGASILLTPVIPLAFTGMEHLLHILMVLLVTYFLWRLLVHDGPIGRKALWALCISTAVAVAVRYESLFLVAAASIALAAKRRWTVIAVCGACALIPICSFGILAVANGQPFLPVSLLLKGNIPVVNGVIGIVKSLGFDGLQQLVMTPHLYILTLCLVVLFWWEQANGRRPDGTNLLLVVVVTATALHVQFARTDWFYRYEAYLVALALVVLSIQFRRSSGHGGFPGFRKRPWMIAVSFGVMLVVLLLPLAKRAAGAHFNTIQATKNIYQQQYQMGLFLHRFYDGQPVAANDIGAINYLARLRVLDLTGLGSREVSRHRRNGSYSTAVIRELARERGIRIAVVYTSRLLPEEWTLVGTWTISNNIVCGGTTVSFLAAESSEIHNLLEHLRSFSSELPRGVVWKESIAGEVIERTPALDEERRSDRTVPRE